MMLLQKMIYYFNGIKSVYHILIIVTNRQSLFIVVFGRAIVQEIFVPSKKNTLSPITLSFSRNGSIL